MFSHINHFIRLPRDIIQGLWLTLPSSAIGISWCLLSSAHLSSPSLQLTRILPLSSNNGSYYSFGNSSSLRDKATQWGKGTRFPEGEGVLRSRTGSGLSIGSPPSKDDHRGTRMSNRTVHTWKTVSGAQGTSGQPAERQCPCQGAEVGG